MFALCLSHYLPCLYIWGSLRVGRRKPKVRCFIAAVPPHRTTTCTDLDRPNADTAWPLYSKDIYSTWSPHAQSFKWGLQNFQIGWVAMHNAAPVIFISPYLQKYYPAARQKQDERDDFPRDWKELPAVISQHINAPFDIWRSPFLHRELLLHYRIVVLKVFHLLPISLFITNVHASMRGSLWGGGVVRWFNWCKISVTCVSTDRSERTHLQKNTRSISSPRWV